MPFTKKTAKAAATKRWNQPRDVKLVQPQYAPIVAPPLPSGNERTEIAAELPTTINSLAGGIPKWEDPLIELSATAYVEARRNYAVVKAHRKLAVRTQKLNWTMVGEGARAEAFMEIFGQVRSWNDFVDHCTGSVYEGTRPYQIKTMPAREGSTEMWAVPDFWLGGRHRYNAGGDIEWDGANKLVQVQRSSGVADRQTRSLPRDQFAIHRPGPGSNPEGYLDIGVALYNAVVKPTNRGITSADLWVRLFAVPAILAGAKMDETRATYSQTLLEARAKKIQSVAGTGNTVGLTNPELIQLLQADPSGLSGMVAWLTHLEGIADDILTLGALMSSAGIAQADRTGDTSEHKNNEDEAAFANGVAIAETWNRDVHPWIVSRNPDLPPLEEGQQEVYLWPKDPNEADEQDVDTETEGEPMDTSEAIALQGTLESVTHGTMTPEAAIMLLAETAPSISAAKVREMVASAIDTSTPAPQ